LKLFPTAVRGGETHSWAVVAEEKLPLSIDFLQKKNREQNKGTK